MRRIFITYSSERKETSIASHNPGMYNGGRLEYALIGGDRNGTIQ